MSKKIKEILPGKDLQKLSLSIGNFIRYWGFRRIHGAVWTQLYLSKAPLSCTDLTERLGLSKALISPALEELCKHELISLVPAPNDRTKLYRPSGNITEVIHRVLRSREAKMLSQITRDFAAFELSEAKSDTLDQVNVRVLREMISSANLVLDLMLAKDDLLTFPSELKFDE